MKQVRTQSEIGVALLTTMQQIRNTCRPSCVTVWDLWPRRRHGNRDWI